MYSLQSKAIYLQRQIYGNVLSFINHPSASKCRILNSIKGLVTLASLCTLLVKISLCDTCSVCGSQVFSFLPPPSLTILIVQKPLSCLKKQTSNNKRNKEMSAPLHAAPGPIKDEFRLSRSSPCRSSRDKMLMVK